MKCPNCHATDIKVTYSDSHVSFRCLLRPYPCYAGEHNHCKCRRCGYAWMTA